ncbi:MAG TPA: PAS domain S-box protein [Vicinamibacteria bacterium]|nr:PAS domain S-box protein [Vicinamibacteria bacterium]
MSGVRLWRRRTAAVTLNVLGVAVGAAAATPPPQPASASPPLALDSIRAIRRLTPRQAEAGYPVHLRAVVTHYNELAFVDLHVHDRWLGQYISFRGTQRLRQSFHPGDLVDVDGVTVRGEFAPDVMPSAIRIVGTAPLPRPRRYSYAELATGRHDCEWIEITGVVQGARLIKTEQTVLALDVVVSGGSVRVQFWDFEPGDAERFIDAMIRVVGNCGTVPTPTAQFRGVRLMGGHTGAIEVVRPAPDPFAAPPRPLEAVLQFSADEPDSHRIRVQGSVTAQRLGSVLYVQDATGAMRVETEQPTAVQPGDRVDVAGFAVPTPIKPILRGGVFRKVASGAPPRVRELTPESAVDSAYDAELVRIRGLLLGRVIGPGEQFLVVQGANTVFRASLEGLAGVQSLAHLREGSEIAVTGIYRFHAELPQSFQLELRAPSDVVLIMPAPWWTPRATLVMLAALAVVGGVAWAWVGTVSRKNARLAVAEAAFRDLFDHAPVGYHELDAAGRVLRVNRTELAMLGYAAHEVVGRPAWDFTEGESAWPAIQEVLSGRAPGASGERVYRRRDGTRLAVLAEDHAILDPAARVTGLRGTIQDIGPRKRAEEALEGEKELLAVTLRSIGDAVIATDVEGRVKLFNRVAEHLTGWSHQEALGRPLADVFRLVNPRTRERCEDPIDNVLKSGTAVALASRTALVSRSGVERVIADSGAPIRDAGGQVLGVVLVFRDVTDKERLDQELARSQKLESIATLAGGIAHDFNNLLTGVLGYLSLAQRSLPDDRTSERLRAAEKATLRARDLTQQLLTFSKGGAPVRQPGHVAELIRESVAFALRGSNVVADIALAPDLWAAEIDAGQISQAISNVALNAVQAMPAGGRLRVRAENAFLDDHRFVELPGGCYLRIALSDTGAGIVPEVLDHVFDPYFTTKDGGSGLGLATTYSIVKNHDGHITVDSVVGEGATFTIYLPATARAVSAAPSAAAATPSRGGRVLVMDDDDVVGGLVATMLTDEGFSAERARDGAEALELYRAARAAGRPFDVVIMDLTVPGGMGGKEATARLLEEDPEARVIVSSGYSNDPIMANYRDHGFSGVLSKPYRVADVSAAIREVLARPDDHPRGAA